MPEETLADITAAPDVSALPDYQLSPFTAQNFGTVEKEFKRQFVATIAESTTGLAEPVIAAFARGATERIVAGAFAYGTTSYDDRCFEDLTLPFLTWISAVALQPKCRRSEVEAIVNKMLVSDKSAFYKLKREVLKLMGFPLRPLPGEKTKDAK